MGIGYDAEIVLYNCIGGEIGVDKTWYGTKISSVRIDLQKSVNISETGSENASTCSFSVYDANLPKDYLEPETWRVTENRGFYITFDDTSFIVIGYAPSIGAMMRSLPIGKISDTDYEEGFIEYLKTQGHVYRITGTAHYSLIPHWEITAG